MRRADEPIVLANPNGWISDDCTGQAFSMAHAALYDRLEFNDTVDTIVPTKPAPLMVAVEDFPWNAGIVATGSQFPITHAIIRDNLQRFRPVS